MNRKNLPGESAKVRAAKAASNASFASFAETERLARDTEGVKRVINLIRVGDHT
jgi:hypothetical protein